MKKNRVFNILFIIFTVMVVVGIVSMVKTVVMPKEDVQDVDGFVVEDEATDEPEVVAKNEEGKKKKQPENNAQDKGKKVSQNEKTEVSAEDVNKQAGPTETPTPVAATETPAPTENPATEYTDEDTVKKVQEALNASGKETYSCGDADGIPGEGTQEAIRNYQADNGLIPDGRITDKLLEKLEIKVSDFEGNQEADSGNNGDIPENTNAVEDVQAQGSGDNAGIPENISGDDQVNDNGDA